MINPEEGREYGFNAVKRCFFECGLKSGLVLPASNPEDVERTYLELKERGVEFSEELTTTDWGKYAIFRDPDVNEFGIS